jgi:hypothetical protein
MTAVAKFDIAIVNRIYLENDSLNTRSNSASFRVSIAVRKISLTASAHPLSTSDAEGVSEREALFERDTKKDKSPSALSVRHICTSSKVSSLFIHPGQS